MLRKIYYFLSPNLRLLARKIFYFPVDLYEGISGKRQKDIPKKGDIFIGSGDFVTQGESQVSHLKNYIDLKPTDKVLDIGCGIGRTAFALQNFINKEGSYDGFDAMKKGIDWCDKNIHQKNQNFNFKYAPLKNALYNKSEGNAEFFKFPYSENQFDKAFLFSVFTHMKINEIQNYLNEICRTLKPNGKCLATFFIYSDKDNLDSFEGFRFPIKRDGYRLLDKNVEEANIAIEIKTLEKMIAISGLKLEEKINGFWNDFTKNKDKIDFQDIIILKK
ncbi:class I SAM-dependent methyltransferase [Halpernia sp.]|uniref:class I SAM-dependent methyltransferase n=1 Tax=Halpernia sp. TaxID=2782209 RepID=UPI003A8CA83F